MNESDEFRQQVEELKQRLGATKAQQDGQASELTSKLASIKAMLHEKQAEIERLTTENQQLRVMLDEVIALLNQRHDLNSGQVIEGFFSEISQFISEEGTQTAPAIELSAPPQPTVWQPEAQESAEDAIAPAPSQPEAETPSQEDAASQETVSSAIPVEPSAKDAIAEESASEKTSDTASEKAADGDADSSDEGEESQVPALKRILKRGTRGR